MDKGEPAGRRRFQVHRELGNGEGDVKRSRGSLLGSDTHHPSLKLGQGTHFTYGMGCMGKQCLMVRVGFQSLCHMPSEGSLYFPTPPPPSKGKGWGSCETLGTGARKLKTSGGAHRRRFPLGTKCFTVFVSPYRFWLLPSRLFETVGSEKRLHTAAGL